MDVSGNETEPVVDVSGGSVTDVSGTVIDIASPPVIRLSDILTEQTLLQQQETNDTQSLASLVNPSLSDLRAKLIAWAARNFTLPCDLIVFTLNPPSACSDGVSRNLFDYIQFLTGKTLEQHVATLQAILPDFCAVYLREGNTIKVGVVTL